MSYSAEQIAQVCHEANRALQQVQRSAGDHTVPVSVSWHMLSEADKARATSGVRTAGRGATPVQLHEEWREALEAEGWVFGPAKDGTLKTHPNLVAYSQLSAGQRIKDHLFGAIVNALASPAGSSVAAEHLIAHADAPLPLAGTSVAA